MGCRISCMRHSPFNAEPAAYRHPQEHHAPDELRDLIANNPMLKAIAHDYLEDVLTGIKQGLADLNACLLQCRSGVETVETALVFFQNEEKEKNDDNRRKSRTSKKARRKKNFYAQTIDKLEEFDQEGDPFAHLNIKEFLSIRKKLREMVDKLRQQKKGIEERLRSTKWWREALNAIFTVVFIGVLVCSVVLAALVAVPVAITAATAGATAMKAAEPWMDAAWDGREKALEDEKEVIEMMRDHGFPVHELDSIRTLVDMLMSDYKALRGDVVFVLNRKNEEDAIEVGMMVIKSKIESGKVRSSLDDLKSKADAFAGEIQRAEKEFRKIVTN